jgi:hypothetical protein
MAKYVITMLKWPLITMLKSVITIVKHVITMKRYAHLYALRLDDCTRGDIVGPPLTRADPNRKGER